MDRSATENFKVTPSSFITGDTTSYTFSFYTNIDIDVEFKLLIEFPSTMEIDLTNTECTSDTGACDPTVGNTTGNSQIAILEMNKL